MLLSQGREIRSYKVALGSEPVGPKTRQGDHRTPEGIYTLDSRNPNSQFYKAFHISYPSPKDIAAAKKQGISPGGDIMLHGLPRKYAWVGKAHTLHDWTDGCIAVTNEEMDGLWKLVPVGTTIEIKLDAQATGWGVLVTRKPNTNSVALLHGEPRRHFF